MSASLQHDYVQTYERAIDALRLTPKDQELQHKAVLALARAGSTRLALAEYNRYGLDAIRNHEDIMALGARLSKDLYLYSEGKTALDHARDAAHKYEAAFKDSNGFYSGVNAAAMALMAEMPGAQINDRTKTILATLPVRDKLSSEEHYFIEATRAECFLLLGDSQKAHTSLISAISHDPLNYTAHASTLKQFRMILNKQDKPTDWLDSFSAPQAVHFAGHIFGRDDEDSQMDRKLSKADIKELKIQVTDMIQKHDIGFAYGALAAGSDIIMAEAFLNEGVELNLILPTHKKDFIEKSVEPYGKSWVKRFNTCFKQANSVTTLSTEMPWPTPQLNRFNGQFAMGQAVLKSRNLSTQVSQFLIWNEKANGTYTSTHAKDWSDTGRDHIIACLNKAASKPNVTKAKPLSDIQTTVTLARSDKDGIETFSNVLDAAEKACKITRRNPNAQIGLHMNIGTLIDDIIATSLAKASFTTGIAVSENFASLLALQGQDNHLINYAGIENGIRAYTLRRR